MARYLAHLLSKFGRFVLSCCRRCGYIWIVWLTFIAAAYWYRSEQPDNNLFCAVNPKLCKPSHGVLSAGKEFVVATIRNQSLAERTFSDVTAEDTYFARKTEDDFPKFVPGNTLPKEYEERKRQVERVCRDTDISIIPSPDAENKVYSAKHSVFYCGNLQVATTFMDGFLPHIFKCSNSSYCFSKPTIYKHLINRSYSFTIVRDPYERLFSGYENKLFLPNKFWSSLGADVVATVRPNASWSSLAIGHDVTFKELVQYIIIKGSRDDLNPHFMPMYKLCNPCHGSYTFIGKLESMSTDIDNLVSDLKQNGRIENDMSSSFEIEASVRKKQLVGPVHHLFTTLNFLRTYASNSMRKKLRRHNLFLRTWSSYQIRGVILKNFSMPFKPSDRVTHDMYAEAVLSAAENSAPYKTLLKAQRGESLIQAYRKVPLELMEKLREFVNLDCKLFGYDDKPSKLFDISSEYVIDFNYFQGLHFPSANSTSAELQEEEEDGGDDEESD